MPDKTEDNPAAVYRDSLSRGSYWAVHHSLETIVKLLGATDPWTRSMRWSSFQRRFLGLACRSMYSAANSPKVGAFEIAEAYD